MFDRFRKEAPDLQIYGKLELAKDYLRVGASKGTARNWREWLDEAFSSRATQGDAPRFAWPARFLVSATGDAPLQGCVWPSSDSGGERHFPFSAFVARNRKPLLKTFQERLVSLDCIWRDLVDYHASHPQYADGQSFLAAMRGRTLQVERPTKVPNDASELVSWEAWTGALWPTSKQDGLVDILISLKQLGSQRDASPIRLPLAIGQPFEQQVHGWWSALVALGLIGGNELPTVFFPLHSISPDEPAFATFITQPLRPNHAEWVCSSLGCPAIGPGDFALPTPSLADPSAPVTSTTPELAISMRGALATARARS